MYVSEGERVPCRGGRGPLGLCGPAAFRFEAFDRARFFWAQERDGGETIPRFKAWDWRHDGFFGKPIIAGGRPADSVQ